MLQAAAADPEQVRLAGEGLAMVREKVEFTIPPVGVVAFATAAGPGTTNRSPPVPPKPNCGAAPSP